MKRAITTIESRWGALGAIAILQCYGLLTAYYFAGAMRHATASSSIYDMPGHALEICVGLLFMAIFIYAQGGLTRDVTEYLKSAKDIHGWLRDGASLQGILRILIMLGAVSFYAALLLGKVPLGLPRPNIIVLLGYQLFHPLASRWLGKRLAQYSPPTEIQFVSAPRQAFEYVMCMFAASVFYGFGIWMSKSHEPACWMFQMLGSGIAAFGLVGFLLEDLKGRLKEVIIKTE